MKIGWLVCVFVVVGLSSTTIAQAQKIVIIDTQRVITESIIGKAAKNNLEVEIKKGQAKVAALKKTTIICTKGKLTKKVAAVKPKCPPGYKVKK